MAGRPLPVEECDQLWRAWTPAEAAERLSSAPPCWYVAAGWALDLFAGDGYAWPFPEGADRQHQTWLREPATGLYRLDVFREPHCGDRWVCRRDASITLPYDELILRTADGIPYATPEVVLLFKAKARRAKDETDFLRALPEMDRSQRSRLSGWLSRVHPGHPWLETLSNHTY